MAWTFSVSHEREADFVSCIGEDRNDQIADNVLKNDMVCYIFIVA